MGLLLFLAFVGVPLIEIFLFIEVGGLIGAASTIAIVVLTALAGSVLLRRQGISTLNHAKQDLEAGQVPVEQVIHGIFLVFAGALLLTPGFMTDLVGLLLFVPPFRLALGQALLKRMMASGSIHVNVSGFHQHRSDGVIDGEAVEIDEDRD